MSNDLHIDGDFTLNIPHIDGEFTENEQPDIQADFSIKLTPEKVSQLENDLNYQTQEQVQDAIQAESDVINARIDDEVNTLNSAIESEATTRADNDNTLQGNINTVAGDLTLEISNRTSADEVLEGNIDTVSGNLATEISDRQDADATLQGNINTVANDLSIEETARINADTTLQGNIDTLSGTVTSNYNTLDGKITDEATARGNADTTLQNNIDTLSGTVTSNYNTLSSAISDETSARQSADTTLQNNITAEATARGNADTTLQGNIDTLSGTVSSNYTTLNGKITDEATARGNADDVLDGKIGDNKTSIDNHVADKTNPHEVTKSQVGLGNCDNTSDLDKPISTATQTALDGKQNTINDLSEIRTNASNGQSAYNTIQNYGDIVTYNASSFATSIQGQKADTALQPNDDISELNNDVGYITSASLPTVNNSTITFQKNDITVGDINLNQANNETINFNIPTTASDVNALPDTTTINDLTTTAQQNAIDSGANTTNIGQIATNTQAISTEATNRQNADNALQSQIDALVVASDVFDIVGTYAELQAYDISTVPVNDIIKVLVDSTHDNAATYYRCVENENVKSWSYIGAEGAYYTKSESNSLFVDKSTTINGQDLSNNITLTASDVGALPSSTIIGSGILTIQNNGVDVDTFNANATSNKSINIVTPTKTSDLINDSGFIDNSDLSDFVTQTDLTDGLATKQDTISDLSTIRSNAQNGQSAYTTIQGYGDIVSYNASNFATSAQGSKADSAVQSVTTGSTNGTIDVDGSNVSVYGLGSAAYTNSSAYATSTQGGKADSAIQTVKVNNTALTPDSSKAVNITVPTDTGDLTNNAGYIKGINSTDVTNALGYTPYDSTNPNGYTSNTGTVTSVNNANPDANGNVTLSIPAAVTVDSALSSTSTNPVQNKVINSALSNKYDASNPNGYTSNVGTVTKVNNTSPDSSGNVTLSIPAAQIQSDWTQTTTTAKDYIKNKPSLSTVATSGSYNDLTNKPTIPTVNNATLTIQKNGTTVKTFTANASSNVTCNITVPTNTNELTNGAGFITSSAIPTIATSVSGSSTNAETVGAKLFYDTCGDIESLINAL